MRRLTPRTAGLTLIELLSSLAIVVLLIAAIGRTYVAALQFESSMRDSRAEIVERQRFESTVTDLIRRSYINTATTSTTTYFISGTPTQPTTTTSSGTTSSSTTTTTSSTGASSSDDMNTLTFTTIGDPFPHYLLSNTDTFEVNNQNFGPLGGTTEVMLSTTSVGSQASNKSGVFLRTQTPSDDDPTQGGNEQLLAKNVTMLQFEFFDGTEWLTSWDTQTMTPKRLPAAVRVTYRYQSDQQDHILVIRLPYSDVTTTDPITTSSSTTGATQ